MKLFVTLVILFVSIGAAIACESYGQKCVDEGEPCPPSYIDPFTTCQYDAFCWFGDNPKDGDWGNCTAYVKEGGFCGGNIWQCGPGLNCYSRGDGPSTCQYQEYATVGESCESSDSCSNSNECVNGKCQLYDGNCQDTWTDCPFGFSCGGSGKCIPTLAEGAVCGDDSANCAVGLICSPTSTTNSEYKCIAINSKGPGQACSSTSSSFDLDGTYPEVDCDVSQGLACIRDNNGEYTCQMPEALGSGNCSASYNCGDGQFCFCPVDSYTGSCAAYTQFNADCSSAINDLVQCAIDHECQVHAYYTQSPKSCMYQHCSKYMCNGACSSSASIYDSSCDYPTYVGCRIFSSSSIVRPTILAIIALVALLF